MRNEWTRGDVIKAFQTGFQLDYQFLDVYAVPLDRCRSLYQQSVEVHEATHQKILASFTERIAAYLAMSKEAANRFLMGLKRLEDIRDRAERTKRFQYLARFVYWLAMGSFVCAMALLARGVLAL